MAQTRFILVALSLLPFCCYAQLDLVTPFKNCPGKGSTTIYDQQHHQWIFSDSLDAQQASLPASTFKVINLLIALETKVIRDEHEVVKWVGHMDTLVYGNRPEIYHDMSIQEAFELSAGWVFIELAKRVGRDRYRYYLTQSHYGNGDLSEPGTDFWNIGVFGISPINQVNFLRHVYSGEVPFSKRNMAILKRVMVTEQKADYTIRSKTGWTRYGGNDTGWWVGYVERKRNTYFFATRLIKPLPVANLNFGPCRKEITRTILQALGAL